MKGNIEIYCLEDQIQICFTETKEERPEGERSSTWSMPHYGLRENLLFFWEQQGEFKAAVTLMAVQITGGFIEMHSNMGFLAEEESYFQMFLQIRQFLGDYCLLWSRGEDVTTLRVKKDMAAS